jgi:hypothetical protein
MQQEFIFATGCYKICSTVTYPQLIQYEKHSNMEQRKSSNHYKATVAIWLGVSAQEITGPNAFSVSHKFKSLNE